MLVQFFFAPISVTSFQIDVRVKPYLNGVLKEKEQGSNSSIYICTKEEPIQSITSLAEGVS